jgi:thymidylate synthase
MLVLTSDNANDLYAATCREVRRQGRSVAPRGHPTLEVMGAHLRLTEPRRRLVDLPPTRQLNPAFAVAEALWILSGSDDPWIFTYNRVLETYADDGRLQGAYGPRIRRWRAALDQLSHVRTLLARDPDSRQAVVQLYDPVRDTRGHRDVPCTLNYRFYVRDGCLDMHTSMRSNDVWLGLPYDIFTATVLHELMAGWVDVDLGTYHHHVDSLHLYDQHAESAGAIGSHPAPGSPSMSALAAPADQLTEVLSAVVAGTLPTGADVWRPWAAVLTSYRLWSDGDRPAARAAAENIGGVLGGALRRWYEHPSQLTAARGSGR